MPRPIPQKETHPFGPNPMALFFCSCGARFAVTKYMFEMERGAQVHCPHRIYGKCEKVYALDYLETLAKRAPDVYNIHLETLEGRNVENAPTKVKIGKRWNDD